MSDSLNNNQQWGVPERIAAWAAGTGLGMSALLMLAYRAAANGGWGGIELRSAIETACVLVWPSAILMKGAQTAQGETILFLFSAALNAGYYVFISLAAYLLHGKLETVFASMTPSNVVPLRVYSAPRVLRRS